MHPANTWAIYFLKDNIKYWPIHANKITKAPASAGIGVDKWQKYLGAISHSFFKAGSNQLC